MIISDKKAKIKSSRYSYEKEAERLLLEFEISATVTSKAGNFRFLINDQPVNFSISNLRIKDKVYGKQVKAKCSIYIPRTTIERMDVHNFIRFCYDDDECTKCMGFLSKNYRGRSLLLADKTVFLPAEDKVLVLVPGGRGLSILARKKNITDERGYQLKLLAAYAVSKILFFFKPVLIFEKNGERYEESGSIVFEKLVDTKHNNVKFLLDANYPYRQEILPDYQKHIVDKHTFMHYLCFFSAKTFIASEVMPHALELRTVCHLAKTRINKGKYSFVFLQHGVMYMVSLNAPNRQDLHTIGKNVEACVVVSSKLEKDHFLEYTEYEPKNILTTGLPKFDTSYKNDGAKKIAIMLTWRPWEEGLAKTHFEDTGYYRCLSEIFNAIPEGLKKDVWIMPHPLISSQIREQGGDLAEYLSPEDKYDFLLRDVDLLITDYSSISYDAFYRGTNVIFYWKEKDRCMKQYGEGAHLMLTEDLAFGKVVYKPEDLSHAVEEIYQRSQPEPYIKKYRKIVEFHDGKNTERVLERISEKGLI